MIATRLRAALVATAALLLIIALVVATRTDGGDPAVAADATISTTSTTSTPTSTSTTRRSTTVAPTMSGPSPTIAATKPAPAATSTPVRPAPSEPAPAPAPSTTPTTGPTTTATEPSPTRPTTTTAAPPPYRASARPVTAEELGSSYSAGRGCTDPDGLRLLTVRHWGYDGAPHDGRLVVAAGQVDALTAVFADLYANRLPIQRMVPVDAYGGDDQASMRANNTSAYNCRTVAGSTRLSNHAFGTAVDVNPLHNPYVRGSSVDPPEGRPWADRSRRDPGMIHAGDATVQAFASRGWKWGGYWSSGQDYQHFSVSGT